MASMRLVVLRSQPSRVMAQGKHVLRRPDSIYRFQQQRKATILDSTTSFFKDLRVTAAKALTESLDESERDELLHKYEKVEEKKQKMEQNEKTASHVPEQSIAEAHALAELTKMEKEMAATVKQNEKDKQRALEDLRKAERARADAELAALKRKMQFDKWQKELQASKQAKTPTQDEKGQSSAVSAAAPPSASQHTDENQAASKDAVNFGDHPLLGKVLSDWGYKRVHLVPIDVLESMRTWKKQRIYRKDRSKKMVSDKLKTLHLGLPGIISMYEDKDGILKIVDGQHRVGMLSQLKNDSRAIEAGFDFDKILVEVYYDSDRKHQETETDRAVDIDAAAKSKDETTPQDLFLEINKAQPVKLVDLPGVAKASDRNIINKAADNLAAKFPDMFKPSQQCRAPHINIDNLRDALFASDAIQRHSITSQTAMTKWIMDQNANLKTKYELEENKEKLNPRVLDKAVKYDFYLGLDATWYAN